jgi:polysaccharide export outer membrane protein
MRLFFCIAAAILCVSIPGLSQTQPPVTGVQTDDDRYRIGYQDTLEVQVFRHPELNRRVSVNPNGTINLFRLDQPIMAVCKTETELARDIEKAYEKDYLRNPEVSVLAVEQKSQAVHVINAVKKPGSFYITRKTQLLELIAAAGGPDVEHVGSRVIVARPGSTSNCKMNETENASTDDIQLLTFKLKDIQEGKVTLWMKPGDVVSVLPADQIYVYGNVNKQGVVAMREPLTLRQALASAEGIRPATKTDSIRVIRQKPGSTEHEEFVYNLKEIAKGTKPDPFLEPNDIVAVSEDKAQSIINHIGRSLTNGIPSIFYRVPTP